MSTGSISATAMLQQAAADGSSNGGLHDCPTGSTARTTGSLRPLVHAAGLYQIVTVTQEDQDNMFVRPHNTPQNTSLFRVTCRNRSIYLIPQLYASICVELLV